MYPNDSVELSQTGGFGKYLFSAFMKGTEI